MSIHEKDKKIILNKAITLKTHIKEQYRETFYKWVDACKPIINQGPPTVLVCTKAKYFQEICEFAKEYPSLLMKQLLLQNVYSVVIFQNIYTIPPTILNVNDGLRARAETYLKFWFNTEIYHYERYIVGDFNDNTQDHQ